MNNLNNISDKQLSLTEIRDKIISLDNELINLLANRRDFSRLVAQNKLSTNMPIRDQSREQILLSSLVIYARELGLEENYITRLFHLIIEDSIIFQQKYLQTLANPKQNKQTDIKVAVLGGKGSYSYLAAKNYFTNNHFSQDNSSNNFDFISGYSSFKDVFRRVEDEKEDIAIVPFENTTSGGITEVFDLLLESELSIIGETKYAIEHCLVVAQGTQLKDIKTIYAHPEASRQCNKNLRQFINLDVNLVSSSTKALQLVVENRDNKNLAAIASKEAAELFSLEVLLTDIANRKDNCTRFFILAKGPIKVSTQVSSKISLVVSTGQKSGALAEILNLFKDANIILSKLESRPIPEKPWEQMFYLDIEANIMDQNIQHILNELNKLCSFVKILGCYPTQDIIATKISAKTKNL